MLGAEARALLRELLPALKGTEWAPENVEQRVRSFAEERSLKLGSVAQPLRAALTGSTASPGIFEVMDALGREETLGRIADAAALVSASDARIC